MLKEASRQKAFLGASKTSDAAKNWRNTSATTRKMVTKRGAAECRSGTGVLWSFTRATRFVSKLSERSLVSTWCPSIFLALSYSSVVVSSAAYAFGRNPFLKAWVQIFAEILPKCFMMRVKKCGAHHAVEWRLLFHVKEWIQVVLEQFLLRILADVTHEHAHDFVGKHRKTCAERSYSNFIYPYK